MEMKSEGELLVTIVTPTYNRRIYLKRLYSSLCRQTNKGFIWYVIDDGSSDGSGQYIEEITDKAPFPIVYLYKNNGGKHTALNIAFKTAKTKLIFIVDGDDVILEDAIETIYKDYHKIEFGNICGIVYKKGFDINTPIGVFFHSEGFANYNKMRYVDNVRGDHAEVWKTEFLSKYAFPEFEGEKFISEGYVWSQMCQLSDVYLRNKVIYVCEYLPDGLTNSGRKLRINNPRGGMATAHILLGKNFPLKIRVKNMLLYSCYGFFAKEDFHEIASSSGNLLLAYVLLPASKMLYIWWKWRYMR